MSTAKRHHEEDTLESIDEQLAHTPEDSPSRPILLANKAGLLVQDYRMHEALQVLQSANKVVDVEASIRDLREELEKLHEEMRNAAFPVPRSRLLPPSELLPPNVEVRSGRDGQLGLFSVSAFSEGDVVFVESPMAVLHLEGHDACPHCLRPLVPLRRVVRGFGGRGLFLTMLKAAFK